MANILEYNLKEPESETASAIAIVAHEKTGKSTIMSQLPSNTIVDTQGGYKSYRSSRIRVESWNHLMRFREKVVETKSKAIYLTVDTVTDIENFTNYIAASTALSSTFAKKLDRSSEANLLASLKSLSGGAGWGFITRSFEEYTKFFRTIANCTFYMCHIKNAAVDQEEATIETMDLLGKNKAILERNIVDSLCFLEREGRFGYLNFKSSEKGKGSRIGKLDGKRILISECIGKTKYKERNVIRTYWENIFDEIDPDYWTKEWLPWYEGKVLYRGKEVQEEIIYDPEYLKSQEPIELKKSV